MRKYQTIANYGTQAAELRRCIMTPVTTRVEFKQLMNAVRDVINVSTQGIQAAITKHSFSTKPGTVFETRQLLRDLARFPPDDYRVRNAINGIAVYMESEYHALLCINAVRYMNMARFKFLQAESFISTESNEIPALIEDTLYLKTTLDRIATALTDSNLMNGLLVCAETQNEISERTSRFVNTIIAPRELVELGNRIFGINN